MADAFSAEGARLYGGRWNPHGLRVVYTASSRSLAILEMLVQDQPLRARYVIIPARIPSKVRIERISASTLPRYWATAGRTDDLRAIGADWIKRAKTAILRVPSAVVPNEFNYLLNPAHPEFARINRVEVETPTTDRRLVQKLSRKMQRESK